jgi:hypothetical protein
MGRIGTFPGGCRAELPCERLRENESVTVRVAGRQEARDSVDPFVPRREPGQRFDVALSQPHEGRGSLAQGKLWPFQRGPLPQGLKAFAERRVRYPERRAQFGFLEPHDEQEQRRPEGGRQERRWRGLDAVVTVTACSGSVHERCRHAELPHASAYRGASEECGVPTRRAVGLVPERVIELQPSAQGRDDEVVREVLDLVRNAAVAPRDSDERRAEGAGI